MDRASPAAGEDLVPVGRERGLPEAPTPPKAAVTSNDPVERGHQLTLTYCTTCHSFTPGTSSPLPGAPNLGKYATEGPFNTEQKAPKPAPAPGSDDSIINWNPHPPNINPAIPMPH